MPSSNKRDFSHFPEINPAGRRRAQIPKLDYYSPPPPSTFIISACSKMKNLSKKHFFFFFFFFENKSCHFTFWRTWVTLPNLGEVESTFLGAVSHAGYLLKVQCLSGKASACGQGGSLPAVRSLRVSLPGIAARMWAEVITLLIRLQQLGEHL